MSLHAYTLIVSYIMAFIGLSAVSLTGAVGSDLLLLTAFVQILSLYINLKRPLKLPPMAWNIAAVVVFSLFLIDYLTSSGSLIESAIRFITLLAVLRLFDLNTTRDHLLLYAMVFFQLLGAAASSISPLFFLVLSAFILSSIWGMIVLNLKRDIETLSPGTALPKGIFGSRFFLTTLIITSLSIIITLTLFFIIPRMGIGFFDKKTLNTIRMTAFSDKVSLGDIGEIKKNTAVVMRIELSSKSSKNLWQLRPFYFRGGTLDSYDGRNWERKIKDKRLLRRNSLGSSTHPNPLQRDGIMVEQSIMLEPLDTDIIFALEGWQKITGIPGGRQRYKSLWTDSSDALYFSAPPYRRISYSVQSTPTGLISERPLSPAEEALYLELPGKIEQVRELALSVTENSNNTLNSAELIEAHLKNNYSYTLNPPRGKGLTPIDDFLFYTKQGYCEQYATSMALMLRSIGIPSRLVTGFLEGEWNSFGEYLIIRQQDAHSWVEAYIEGIGWLRFDPTASGGLTTPSSSSRFSQYLDSIRWRWNRSIIGFTLKDQVSFVISIDSKLGKLRELIKGGVGTALKKELRSKKIKKDFIVPLAIITSVLVIGLVFIVFRKRRSRGSNKTPAFYIEMIQALKKRGLERGIT
jgi:transglutaminase-like putative cysteine protease